MWKANYPQACSDKKEKLLIFKFIFFIYVLLRLGFMDSSSPQTPFAAEEALDFWSSTPIARMLGLQV